MSPVSTSISVRLRINANGGRYYEPAPGLTFHGGVELAF
jgi:hypothetical protein